MNSFNIRFPDILRYFVLGCIIEVLLLWISLSVNCTGCPCKNNSFFEELPKTWENMPNNSLIHPIALVTIFISAYLLGFLVQTIIQVLFGGNFLETGIGEQADFIRFFPTLSMKINKGFPNWLYYSDNPRQVINIYRNILETGGEAETKTEFLYSNQLFQGLSFVSLLTTVYCVLQPLDNTFDWLDFLILTLFTSLIIYILLTPKTYHFKHYKYFKIAQCIILCILMLLFFYKAITANHLCIITLALLFVFILSVIIASVLARKQIKRIDILANFNKQNSKDFNQILAQVGVPRVYVLTRTNSNTYLSEELESIRKQTYPNIKVIVLIDKIITAGQSKDDILNEIDNFRKKGLNIQTYESIHTGPAALANEIRQIFLNYASSKDIAIILDSDDMFSSEHTVSRIVTRMFKTKSNVCLIRFEIFGKQNLNYAKNYHNQLVKALSFDIKMSELSKLLTDEAASIWHDGMQEERTNAITSKQLTDINQLHLISTIGWTKCYNRDILGLYHKIIKDFIEKEKEKNMKLPNPFEESRKYEDFPDIIALLLKKCRICAIEEHSILFRKRDESVTTKISTDNYENHIPFFLNFTKRLAENETIRDNKKQRIIENSQKVIINKLIPYKFVQYLNVVYKKTRRGTVDYDANLKGYSCNKFYHTFVETLFPTTDYKAQEVFQDNIVNIIKTNYEVFDDFPTGINRSSSWDRICECYNITTSPISNNKKTN